MRNLTAIAKDIRNMMEMLQVLASELEDAGALLSGLIGTEEVQARAPLPKAPVKPHNKPSRQLTTQEKEQIRLLWSQRFGDRASNGGERKMVLYQMAEIYQITPKHVSLVIFAKPPQKAVPATASVSSSPNPAQ